MTNLLQAASFERRCPVCGGTYRVSLYDILQQHRLGAQWESARPPHQEELVLPAAVPVVELEELAQAWDRVAAELHEKGLAFDIAVLPEVPHVHPGVASEERAHH